MVRVEAREAFPYANISRAVGEVFDVSPRDAHVLLLIGKVRAVETVTDDPIATVPDDDPVADVAPRRPRRRRSASVTAE